MTEKTPTGREPQPEKWVPPPRAGASENAEPPAYPSFYGEASESRLETLLLENPDEAAAHIAELLRRAYEPELLSRLHTAIGKNLEPEGDAAPPPAVTGRLQELETTVQQLAEKVAAIETTAISAPASAPATTTRPETPHEKTVARVQELVRGNPQDAARLVRTVLMESEDGPLLVEDGSGEGHEETDLPPMPKVAILFVALGEDVSGEVMKHLTDYEIEEITQAVAGLKNVSTDLAERVLEGFERQLLAGEWVVQGGGQFARTALERAVGLDKAQEILDRVATKVTSGFYMLRNVAPDQIAPFISNEHPQTIALILSQLDPAQAAGILAQLPPRMQADVAYRVATMENITPSVIKEIEESLEQSLRDILGGNQDVGGPKVVADIINLTGSSVEKNVLDQMDGQDPDVAESVRNLMFVFDDIAKLTDREIQTLLQEVDQKDLVIALKTASEELKEKILGNMSEEARASVAEELEFLGPMRLTEVEEVQLRIVQQVRQLEEQGQIKIVRGDSLDSFV